MKSFAALLAVTALAACSEPPHPGSPAAQGGGKIAPAQSPGSATPAAVCTLLVSFGSYAMGIDRGTLDRVEALLEADPAVTAVTRSPWGREGEVTLCAAVRSSADRDRLFAAVAALFPRRPHGPLLVRTDDGREFQAHNAT